jgi:hypothetical protein
MHFSQGDDKTETGALTPFAAYHVSFSLYPSRAFTNIAGGGWSRRKSVEGRKREKKQKKERACHSPMTFALPLHDRDALLLATTATCS